MIPLIYVAGPYTASSVVEITQNISRATVVACDVIRGGGFPVTPHLNTGHFGGLESGDFFLNGTMRLMEQCDAVLMMLGWARSDGALNERERARDLWKPILYCSTDRPTRRIVGDFVGTWQQCRQAQPDPLVLKLARQVKRSTEAMKAVRKWVDQYGDSSIDALALMALQEALAKADSESAQSRTSAQCIGTVSEQEAE